MKNKSKRAFTIVELIIVIAVIGILAAILIPSFSNIIEKSNRKSAYADAKNEITNHIIETADNPEGAGAVVPDSLIFVHKANKLYVFEYVSDIGGSVKETELVFDCSVNKNAADYEEQLRVAIEAVLDDLVSRTVVLGSSSAVIGRTQIGAHLTNVHIYEGRITGDMQDTNAYFSVLTPLATLQNQTTTVTDANGVTKEAILIKSTRDLYSFAQYFNNGQLDLATNLKLDCDIFLGGIEWTPIGDYYDSFLGTFDGNGHTIYDLNSTDVITLPYIDGEGNTVQITGCALFGGTYWDGETKSCIKNVNFVNVKTDDSNDNLAAAVYYGYDCVFQNINVSGKLIGTKQIGGIAWYTAGSTFKNCHVNADFTTTLTTGNTLMGGIAAQTGNETSIIDCSYTGTMTQESTGTLTAGYMIAYHIEQDAEFKNFTVGAGSKIVGTPSSGSTGYFTGFDKFGNAITNNVTIYNHDGSVAIQTNASSELIGRIAGGKVRNLGA